jgi:hypothetical protein
MPKEPKDRVTELQPQAAPTWNSMSPGEKMAWLLGQALDCKREILTMPLPDPDDMSPASHRTRALALAAADSTIDQIMPLRTNQLAPAAADGIEDEERRLAAMAEIERMTGKPPNPN